MIDELSDSESKSDTVKNVCSFDEVIGHMQSRDGENLGELVVINKTLNKPKMKGKLVPCKFKLQTSNVCFIKNIAAPVKKRRKYECEICGRMFLHHGRYEVHKTFHNNIKYQCGEKTCNLKKESKQDMEQHQIETGHKEITVIENVENYVSISYFFAIFVTALCSCKKGEIQLPKPEEADVTSEEIDIKDASITEEATKPIITKKEVHICKVCDKKFSCKQNYEVHYKAVHENQRPYECEKCHKSFSYLNSLKCHMLMHSDKTEKLYNCDICNKGFNHPSSLVYHK